MLIISGEVTRTSTISVDQTILSTVIVLKADASCLVNCPCRPLRVKTQKDLSVVEEERDENYDDK